GYNAFEVDITPFMKAGEQNDVLVKLKNLEESSRWYPGAGLYRPVTLITSCASYLDDWATFVRTKSISAESATLAFDSRALGVPDSADAKVAVVIRDADGNMVSGVTIRSDSLRRFSGSVDVNEPQLWTPESPYLYSVSASLMLGDKVVDEQVFKTGIRTVAVSKGKGFLLNGKARKIKGVCLHHDLGPLGAAENKAAFVRQINIMKEMGADAIRTAHNMPSKMQMDVCDSLGMMVMAESFDMWIYPKCKNGYARFFNDWSDRDITNLVKRHRNHPSIICGASATRSPSREWRKDRVSSLVCKIYVIALTRLAPSRRVWIASIGPSRTISHSCRMSLG
ncbi:MAG: glycoside hydrolase family 2 TIM barrel-domain containing protein, partial [Bacteroidales bacterium]|nr:glycoside hydrolase family 2 TIM barrel-domain containing protein [Bacteroidales bacterium]